MVVLILCGLLGGPLFASHEILSDDPHWLEGETHEKVDISKYQGLVATLQQGLQGAELRKEWTEAGQYHLELGDLYRHYKDYDSALSEYQAALDLFQNNKDDRLGLLLTNMGRLYYSRHEYLSALDFDQRAYAFNSKATRNYGVNTADNQLDIANVYSDLGDYASTMEYLRKALKGYEDEAANREGKGRVYKRMGLTYRDLGEPERAVRYLQRAMRIEQEDEDLDRWMDSLVELGQTQLEKGDIEEAVGTYIVAGELVQKLQQDPTEIQKRLSLIYLQVGRPELALPLLKAVDSPFHWGRYYLDIHQPAKAKSQFESSLDLRGAALTRRERVAHLIGIGTAEENMGNYKEAENNFRQAYDLVETLRQELPPNHNAQFLGTYVYGFPVLEAYRGLVRVSEFTDSGNRASFYYSEASRSRLFTEAIAQREALGSAALPSELAHKETVLHNQISRLLLQVDFLASFGNRELLEKLSHQMQVLQAQQTQLVTELRKRFPRYASIRYPQPLSVESVTLAPDEVLLEYAVSGPYTRLFVVKSGRIAAIFRIPWTMGELTAKVAQYHANFENIKDASHIPAFNASLAKELYDGLLKPVFEARDTEGAPLVPTTSRIIIVPDYVLQLLPFESFVTQLPALHTDARYVGDDYDIVYAQSATALMVHRGVARKKNPLKTLFVLADPIFDLADKRVDAQHLAQLAQIAPGFNDPTVLSEINERFRASSSSSSTARGDDRSQRLEVTGILAHLLKTKIFAGEPMDILTGWSADEAHLRQYDLSQYRYLVFATHGMLDHSVPYIQEPALILNQVGNNLTDNGFLTMSKVMKLHINADVVMLNACETGLGKVLPGEGVMAMGRSFQYAGAGAVVESLWSVGALSSAILTETFFKNLREGRSPREALRRARTELRQAGFDHPFYWAPFILMGDETTHRKGNIQ